MANDKNDKFYNAAYSLLHETVMQYGPELCAYLLNYSYHDLITAVANQELNRVSAMVGRPYNVRAKNDMPYVVQAKTIESLCATAAHYLAGNALALTDELIKNTRLDPFCRVRDGLLCGDITRCRQFLGIQEGFKWNPITHDIECGWEPSEGYTSLANRLGQYDRHKLAELAYCVTRMPDNM